MGSERGVRMGVRLGVRNLERETKGGGPVLKHSLVKI